MADQPHHEENVKTFNEADDFTKAYIECALWLAEPQPYPGEYTVEEDDIAAIDPDDFKSMIEDCSDFQEMHEELLKAAYQSPNYTPSRAGHDFFLTRCGHGAGFWDRGLGEIGDKLTKMSKPYGDGTLYCTQGDETDFYPEEPRSFYL